MANRLLERLAAEVAYLAARIGYAVRPYDMLADRRRWCWQPRTRCGGVIVLSEEDADALNAAVQASRAQLADEAAETAPASSVTGDRGPDVDPDRSDDCGGVETITGAPESVRCEMNQPGWED